MEGETGKRRGRREGAEQEGSWGRGVQKGREGEKGGMGVETVEEEEEERQQWWPQQETRGMQPFPACTACVKKKEEKKKLLLPRSVRGGRKSKERRM